ncbi:MAG: helix-turn-helix domain-containing protein [Myxococcota bacterium]
MTDIGILALEGAHAGTVLGLRDVFAIAEQLQALTGESSDPLQTRILGPRRRHPRAATGTPIPIDAVLGSDADPDVLVVPGCMTVPDRMGERLREARQPAELVREYHGRGRIVAGHCSSVFVLGLAGLLEGRRAAVTWWAQSLFMQMFPNAKLEPDANVTVDGSVVCAAGPFSHYILALQVIEMVRGPGLARMCAKFALLDRASPGQNIFRSSALGRDAYPLTYQIETIVRSRLPEVPTVEAVASALGMTPRTLQRRLLGTQSPKAKETIDRVRVDVAKELLETTEASLTAVAEATGYADSANFRRTFRKYTKLSPSAYRRRSRQG